MKHVTMLQIQIITQITTIPQINSILTQAVAALQFNYIHQKVIPWALVPEHVV